MTLYLGNLINFDELQTKYEKRIKVRFNTDWKTTGSGVLHSFQEMYFNDNKLMHDWINTPYSEKRSRQFANELVLQFIELDPHQWLFVDAVSVGVKEGHKFTDSVEPEIYKDLWVTEGESVAELEPYKDRLIVNKKNSRQNWFYTNRDIIDTIAVQQILPASYKNIENKFPGFDNVSRSYKELSLVINQPEWKQALSSVYGVYVVTDIKNGKQYVGSAYGENGIYGRWSTYLNKGFDNNEVQDYKYPNTQFKKIVNEFGLNYIKENFQYSIIEIFTNNISGKEKALQREIYWKNVLKTREHGYNSN